MTALAALIGAACQIGTAGISGSVVFVAVDDF
jgi:hypothetical protein